MFGVSSKYLRLGSSVKGHAEGDVAIVGFQCQLRLKHIVTLFCVFANEIEQLVQ